jgi:hypothetical protein
MRLCAHLVVHARTRDSQYKGMTTGVYEDLL